MTMTLPATHNRTTANWRPFTDAIARGLVAVAILFASPAPAQGKAHVAKSKTRSGNPTPAKDDGPLAEKSTNTILDRYTFVGDFEEKEPERPTGDEIFWRYPYVLPPATFAIHPELDHPKIEMPATKGDGRAVDHLNRGRLLFLERNFEEAKTTWLTARARFGTKYPYHRRNDYFVGMAFLNLGLSELNAVAGDWTAVPVKGNLDNAATFLSWAFIVKTEHPDPLIDVVTPKGLYNLAAIYWRYGRFGGAFGAAETGLNFLRQSGRKDFRPAFHRFAAEAHIKNRSYLEAVQELDLAIRQDRDPREAAPAFGRVGDIYFDLNNYELAEDAYGLALKVASDLGETSPLLLALRGESLFWLGKYSEALKSLHDALYANYAGNGAAPLPPDIAAWSALRMADAYLALKDYEHARLEYYKVGREYRPTLAGRLAKIRSACLELPYYKGNNVAHARKLLDEAKVDGTLPRRAIEIAWACQVGSYTQREQTEEMLTRVRAFAEAYPESGFLRSFAEPVREFQSHRIDDYLAAGDPYRTVAFFEANRRTLFKKVPQALAARLFAIYMDMRRPDLAAEFWDAYAATPDSDLKLLRQVTGAKELVATKTGKALSQRLAAFDAKARGNLSQRKWTLAPDTLTRDYVTRLRLASGSQDHLTWLVGLARHLGEQDPTLICDLEYPVLSKLHSLKLAPSTVNDRSLELAAGQLPDLFKQDESCAMSLLDLEFDLLRAKPAELASLYLKRQTWPLVAGFLRQYWLVSEHLNELGEKPRARSLWEAIAERGTPGAPEVLFAKARLDPTRTEFEKLWD